MANLENAMSPEISLKQFALSDLTRVNELENISFPIDAFRESIFINYYHKHPDLFIVVESVNVILGYMLTYFISVEKALVVSIAIDPNHRRKGVGRILAEYTFKRLKASGVKKVELRVRITNKEGERFWSSLGFKSNTIIPNFYKDGEQALQMVRKLDILMD